MKMTEYGLPECLDTIFLLSHTAHAASRFHDPDDAVDIMMHALRKQREFSANGGKLNDPDVMSTFFKEIENV